MTRFRIWFVIGIAIVAFSRLSQGQTAGAQPTNDDFVERIKSTIAGREREPAGQVFKNVQFLKNTPAATFLMIMNGGYSNALGVKCTYCHDDSDFASDDKRPKRAAREMQVIHRAINDQLRALQNVTDDPNNRAISCITCHRGEVKPFRG